MNMELQQRTKYTLASASILQVRGGGRTGWWSNTRIDEAYQLTDSMKCHYDRTQDFLSFQLFQDVRPPSPPSPENSNLLDLHFNHKKTKKNQQTKNP